MIRTLRYIMGSTPRRVHVGASLALLLGFMLVPGPSATAQVDAARITGVIADSTGAVLPNATVVLHNAQTGLDRQTVTNGAGVYLFLAVPAGTYSETVSASGFGKTKASLTVSVGASATLDLKLATSTSASVEVVATNDAVQVNTTTPEISTVIDTRQVVDLPSLTRNPYDFVALSGNVTSDPNGSTGRGVGVSFDGQRAAGTEILLDGVENEDNYDATVGQAVPVDAVQEYRVITNGFDAQYGRASGGIVNLISKSGSNSFHGSLYEFNRISALASRTEYENAAALPSDHFTRNQFGYSIGGPVLKDKLFFFSNTEFTRIRSAGQQQFEIPTASFIASSSAATQAFFTTYGKLDPKTTVQGPVAVAGFATAPLELVTKTSNIDAGAGAPQNTWTSLNRFDYIINDKISMYFRAGNSRQVFPAGYVSLSPYAGYDTGETAFNQAYLYNLNYAIKPSLLSNSKVSFSRENLNEPLNGAPQPTLYLNQANVESTDGVTNTAIVFPGYSPLTPGNSIPFGGPANVYQFEETMTYVKGKHTITFGGGFLQLRDNRTFGAYEGSTEQAAKTGTKYNLALQALQAGNIYTFEVALNPQGKYPCSYNAAGTLIQTAACTINFPAASPSFTRENTFNDGDWFAEDSYRITPKLNVTYGLRWEYYGVQHNHDPNLESNFFFGGGANTAQQVASGQVLTTPNSPVGGVVAKKFTNYAPRIGVAYDPFGDGKWSVRGGFGISYERNFGNVTYNIIQNPPNYAGVLLTSNYDAVKNPTGTQYQVYTSNFGPFAAAGGSTALPPSSLRALQQNMPTAYTENWLFSVEHQLTSTDLIAVEYTGAHGLHQYAIAGYNGIGYGTFTGSTNPTAYGLNRLNHQYGAINQRIANGTSEYDGLNVRYETRSYKRQGLTMTVNYTYGHALDNLSSTFSESGNNFNLGYLNPFNPSQDWGNADYDVRHRVAVGGLYEPTFLQFANKPLLHAIVGGLEFAPVATVRTGTPFTIYDCTNGENACPRIIQAPGVAFHGSVGANQGGNSYNYLDIPAASANPFTNAQGYSDFPDTLGGYQNPGLARNQWFGPSNVTFDLGVYKNFRVLADRYKVQIRGEFYNVLNHSNYYPVVASADYAEVTNVNVEKGTPGGGSPSSNDERRNVQLAVRIEF